MDADPVPGDLAAARRFLDATPIGPAVLDRVLAELGCVPGVTVRTTRSQVTLRRRRAFAWLWRPAMYLGDAGTGLALAIALGRADRSPRWKAVAHPAAAHWVHHLEVRDPGELDDEVAGWLREAAARAG